MSMLPDDLKDGKIEYQTRLYYQRLENGEHREAVDRNIHSKEEYGRNTAKDSYGRFAWEKVKVELDEVQYTVDWIYDYTFGAHIPDARRTLLRRDIWEPDTGWQGWEEA